MDESHSVDTSLCLSASSETDMSKEHFFFDAVLKYINNMLMEEDGLENKPCMFHDCSALQAAERSFYGVLTENLDNNFTGTSSTGISKALMLKVYYTCLISCFFAQAQSLDATMS